MSSRPYQKDLAHIHHDGFGGFAAAAAPGVVEHLRAQIPPGGRVVELGCGSGILTRRLVKSGYRVLGIDISRDMLDVAKKYVPQATFRHGSFLRGVIPTCDAVVSVGECFNYAFDARAGRGELSRLFKRVHASLRPGGILLFDMVGPGVGRARVSSHIREGDGWLIFHRSNENKSGTRLTREITTFRRHGRHWRRSDEVHRLWLPRPSEIATRLRRAGFRARILRGYGAMTLGGSHAAFLARKT